MNRPLRRNPAHIGFVCARLIMGIVFVYASYDKILHPEGFAQAVYNYQILPGAVVNTVALILPWIELVMGLCLILGAWLPGATTLCVLLLGIFTAALITNEIRGIDVYCGCFSTQSSQEGAGLWTIARDLFFLAISLYLFIDTVFRKRPSTR